jgi:hypothetical protein
MKAMMRRFHSLGLEVRISEIDVARRGDVLSDEELERVQVRAFSGALVACLELPGVCTGYTVWGTHDAASWYQGRPGFPSPEPLLYAPPGERVYDPHAGRCVAPGARVVGAQYCPKAGYNAIRALLARTLYKKYAARGGPVEGPRRASSPIIRLTELDFHRNHRNVRLLAQDPLLQLLQ